MHYLLDSTPPCAILDKFFQHNQEFSKKMHDIFDRHPRVKIVTYGHFHSNTTRIVSNRLHLTSTAFSKAPFQVRLLEVFDSEIRVNTEHLLKSDDPLQVELSKLHLIGDGRSYEILY